MRKIPLSSRLAVLAVLAGLLLASGISPARADRSKSAVGNQASTRRAQLRQSLSSTQTADFQKSLAELSQIDEPGALDLWQTALNNSDSRLRLQAWVRYRAVQAELSRKQFVPQIARIDASSDDILRIAKSAGLEITIWSTTGGQTVAAVPPYLLERLRNQRLNFDVLYDTVADWQRARSRGDADAVAITPAYQQPDRDSSQIRIAVVDLSSRTQAASGYATSFGDREDILMNDGSRIAYLDVFESDGSRASIDSHVAEQYTKRGYTVEGF